MITIEVLECPDRDYLGQFCFSKNFIRVGHSSNAELYLNDKAISKTHIILEIQESSLIAMPADEVALFWVNGKRTTGKKRLNIGDTVQIGQSKFKVVNFLYQTHKSKREALNTNTEELIKSNSPLLSYIKRLQEKL